MVLQDHSQRTHSTISLADQLSLLDDKFLIKLVVLQLMSWLLACLSDRSEISIHLCQFIWLDWFKPVIEPLLKELNRPFRQRYGIPFIIHQVALKFQISAKKFTV